MTKHFLFLVATLVSFSIGCDQPALSKRGPAADAEGKDRAECNNLKAQIVGLDKEIELRLSEKYNIKRRGQAFGRIGPQLYQRMLEHEEKIIQARSKRAEISS